MSFLGKLFTWWNGPTFGTMLWSWRNGEQVGTDAMGNKYFRSKNKRGNLPTAGSYTAGERRWVIYDGANDASRVPAEWHGWIHGAGEDVPESFLPAPRIWEADYSPNATGTDIAYLPQGALQKGGNRALSVCDYEAWTPDA